MSNPKNLNKNKKKSPKTSLKMTGQTLQILGITINSTSTSSVLAFVAEKIKKREKFWIATPNPEMVVAAQSDETFKKVLNSADLAIPDGVGLVWAARLLGLPLKERVTGTDLLLRLCQEAALWGWRVALLGGREGVVEKALAVLEERFPEFEGVALEGPKELQIANCKLQIGDTERNEEAIEKINVFKPDILFVGFGMGKQERWITKYFDILNIGGAVVVGGAFDFYAGRIRRAPEFLRKIGLEWFWRLILEPWRWRRQLSLWEFVWLIFKTRFRP